jgi:hypothetical protein
VPLDEDATARFMALKAWRTEVAKSHNVPAYVVFADASLAEMARQHPGTLDELAGISGVGAKKLEAYGAEILRPAGGAVARRLPAGSPSFGGARFARAGRRPVLLAASHSRHRPPRAKHGWRVWSWHRLPVCARSAPARSARPLNAVLRSGVRRRRPGRPPDRKGRFPD